MVTTPYTFISRINDTSKHFGLNAKTKKLRKRGLVSLIWRFWSNKLNQIIKENTTAKN